MGGGTTLYKSGASGIMLMEGHSLKRQGLYKNGTVKYCNTARYRPFNFVTLLGYLLSKKSGSIGLYLLRINTILQ